MAIPTQVRALLDDRNLRYKKLHRNVLTIPVASVPAALETTLEYDPRADVLTWRVALLKGKKKRRAFMALLRDPDAASAFHALSLRLHFGELRADPMLGPLLQVRWPVCAVNRDSLVRAEALMRDAPALVRRIEAALGGAPIKLPLASTMAFLHRRRDWHPGREDRSARRDDEQARRATARRERLRHLDARRLDIRTALEQGDLKQARALAKAIGDATPSSI